MYLLFSDENGTVSLIGRYRSRQSAIAALRSAQSAIESSRFRVYLRFDRYAIGGFIWE